MQDKLVLLKRAYINLSEVMVNGNIDNILLDAIMKRFQLTYEMCYQTLSLYLSENSIDVFSEPKEVFNKSLELGLLNNETDKAILIRMTKDIELIMTEYDSKLYRGVFERIKVSYISVFTGIIEKLDKL